MSLNSTVAGSNVVAVVLYAIKHNVSHFFYTDISGTGMKAISFF